MATLTEQRTDYSPTDVGEDGRGETPLQRLDRNTTELVSEMRVASLGIQVLFAFLLVVPFNTGWRRVSSFDRYTYFVTFISIAIAAVLLIAPSIHHRILFRRGQKGYLVDVGNRMMIVAMVFLTIGLTGILVLVSDVILGGGVAAALGIVGALGVGWAWFGMPLRRRLHLQRLERVEGP